MTKREAIEFIKKSEATHFTYGIGDLGTPISKEDTIADIENMSEDSWNDGDVFEIKGDEMLEGVSLC